MVPLSRYFLFGRRSSQIPAGYHEIYPMVPIVQHESKIEYFTFEQLATANNLIAQVADKKEIFAITSVELTQRTVWNIRDLGLRSRDNPWSAEGKMLVLTTAKTRLIQSQRHQGSFPLWIAPQLESEDQDESAMLALRFFA